MDAVLPCKSRLCLPDLGQSEVIESEIAREVRLVVPGKQRPRFRDVAPLRETLAPPRVVFRDGVELGKWKAIARRFGGPGPFDCCASIRVQYCIVSLDVSRGHETPKPPKEVSIENSPGLVRHELCHRRRLFESSLAQSSDVLVR